MVLFTPVVIEKILYCHFVLRLQYHLSKVRTKMELSIGMMLRIEMWAADWGRARDCDEAGDWDGSRDWIGIGLRIGMGLLE